MLALFESETCISKNLANYFGENPAWEKCDHCSVCNSGSVKIKSSNQLKALSEFDYQELCKQAIDKLADKFTSELLTKYLCGINTPIFTRLKLKQLSHFSFLENHRFEEVNEWVKENSSL